MAIPIYKLALVRPDNTQVFFGAGSQHEIDLIAAVVAAVSSRSIGLFTTKASVLAAVEDALNTVFLQFKTEAIER